MTLSAARDALLDDARRHAQEIVSEGEQEAHRSLEAARVEADEVIARGRALGEADGRLQATRAQAAERFTARMQVLGAQRGSYDALRERARTAVLALREDPAYPEMLEHLAAAARDALGPDAEVTIDPPDAGGVLARTGSRVADYTLVALAERCVADLGPRARTLWA